jgi:tRNA (guanine10-N2)-methyltransferase
VLGPRFLVDKFKVTNRAYIGTTSMDSALALIGANMAKSAPGKFVIDPFVGTGSLILTCAFFGAVTLGADLDPRVLRGKDGLNIQSNFDAYQLSSHCAGLLVNDLSKLTVWRDGELFDAIVGDRRPLF